GSPSPGSPPPKTSRSSWPATRPTTRPATTPRWPSSATISRTSDDRPRLRHPAGQRGGLFHPLGHLRLVEWVAFADVDPARFLARAAGRNWPQRCAAEEGHLDVVGEDVERQEPTLALAAVKWRVPLHGLAHFGRVPRDERVETLPQVALPERHRRDI